MENTIIVDYRHDSIQSWLRGNNKNELYPIDPKTTAECFVIAMSYGLGGYYVVVDTNDGYVYWGDVQGQHDEPEQEFNGILDEYEDEEGQEWRMGTNVYRPADFFAVCKQRFLEMRWVGFGPEEISSLRMNKEWNSNEEHNKMVDALKKAGWPGDGEGRGYNRDKISKH